MKNPITVPKRIQYREMFKSADAVIKKVQDGDINPLELHIIMKAYATMAKRILVGIDTMAIEEARKYGKADSVINGAHFTVSEGATILNYEGDLEFANLKEKLKIRGEVLKLAYLSKLKGLSSIDPINGEILDPPTVSGGSKQSIRVTFKSDA